MNDSNRERQAHASASAMWCQAGSEHPAFALPPDAGQEPVWNCLRPPRLMPDCRGAHFC